MISQIVTNAIKPCLVKLIISNVEINNITAILDSGEMLCLNVTPTTIHLEKIKNMRKSVALNRCSSYLCRGAISDVHSLELYCTTSTKVLIPGLKLALIKVWADFKLGQCALLFQSVQHSDPSTIQWSKLAVMS